LNNIYQVNFVCHTGILKSYSYSGTTIP